MAPYALALGVIKPFAKNFAEQRLDQCPYIMTRVQGRRTAGEWADLLAEVADAMDERHRQMMIERWTAIHIR
jgi:ferritin-like protein